MDLIAENARAKEPDDETTASKRERVRDVRTLAARRHLQRLTAPARVVSLLVSPPLYTRSPSPQLRIGYGLIAYIFSLSLLLHNSHRPCRSVRSLHLSLSLIVSLSLSFMLSPPRLSFSLSLSTALAFLFFLFFIYPFVVFVACIFYLSYLHSLCGFLSLVSKRNLRMYIHTYIFLSREQFPFSALRFLLSFTQCLSFSLSHSVILILPLSLSLSHSYAHAKYMYVDSRALHTFTCISS